MTTRLGSLLLAIGITWPTPVRAQSEEDKAAAEALYEAGKALLRSDVAAACEKFSASQQLDPGVGTLLHLGACHERLGRVASAWAAFREAASLARRSGQPDREQTAITRAAQLDPRLPKLVIDASASGTAGLEIKRDQKVVPAALLGVPLPLDPGKYTISAEAPGKASWSHTIELVEGRTESVKIPELEAEPAAAPTDMAPPAAAPAPQVENPSPVASPSTPDRAPDRSTLPTQAKIGIAVGAVGVLGIAAGSYFGLRTISKWDEAQQHCQGTLCTREGVDLHDEAEFSGNVSTALFVAGAVAVGTGVVLFLKAPSSKTETRVGAHATRDSVMVSLGGAL